MKGLSVALLLCSAAGCTAQIGHLNLLTAQNVNGMPQPIRRGAFGEDCQTQWTLDLQPNLEKAIANAIGTSGEGNALANVAIYMSRYTYILVNRNCIRVEGDVIQLDGVIGK